MNKQHKQLKLAQNKNQCWKKVELDYINYKPFTIANGPFLERNRERNLWNISYANYFNLDEVGFKSDSVTVITTLKGLK